MTLRENRAIECQISPEVGVFQTTFKSPHKLPLYFREFIRVEPGRPQLLGKQDAQGAPLLVADEMLEPVDIALAIASRLQALAPGKVC